MDNAAIADNFSLLSKLIDIHGDDSFKAKSYSSAAFTIDKLPVQLSSLSADKIYALKGIGPAIGKKVLEQLETGRLNLLDEYLIKTPAGILEMLRIKGLGPKKIATIWKELCIENIGELLYACEENRLLLYKGFGAKTQQTIKESIDFYLNNQGSYLFSQIEGYANDLSSRLIDIFPGKQFSITGDFNRNALVVHQLEWVTNVAISDLQSFFAAQDYSIEVKENTLVAKGPENVVLLFHSVADDLLVNNLFQFNCSTEFFQSFSKEFGWDPLAVYTSEEEVFKAHGLQYIPPFLRDIPDFIEKAKTGTIPEVLVPADIKGIIHSHSDWSDGVNSIEDMVKGAIEKGLEYLVISDHSQSAFYARGLYPDRIKAQHHLIDELNQKYKPFRIFKSIESDILNEGSLDYDDAVLASFDLVIASIHSNFKMSEEKATARLLKAIANPFTTILGHMTGRLLLSRNGYPVDHKTIIDACAAHQVVIEVNAHPRRLDMDYRYIPYAIEKGVLLSIDPDAHAVDAFDDVRNGVLAAQKGGLTKANNLSSFSLKEMEAFIEKQKSKRG